MLSPNFRKIQEFAEAEITAAMPTTLELFNQIYDFLTQNKYTVRNKFDTYDGDYNSYVIPTDPRLKVMVLGSWDKYGGSKMIVILDNKLAGAGFTELTVMRLDKKMKYSKYTPDYVERFTAKYLTDHNFVWRDMNGVYGDIRDEQFVFKCSMRTAHPLSELEDEVFYDGNVAMYLRNVELFLHELNALSCSIDDR